MAKLINYQHATVLIKDNRMGILKIHKDQGLFVLGKYSTDDPSQSIIKTFAKYGELRKAYIDAIADSKERGWTVIYSGRPLYADAVIQY